MPKISEFAAAETLTGTEIIPIVQAGATKRTTTGAIAALGGGSGGAGGTGTPTSYDAMILSEPGLLYYWPLSDASGAAIDLAQGRSLTVTGAPTYGAASLLANGDHAIAFADSSSHLDFDAAVGFYPQAPFTWECFIEFPALPSSNVKFLSMENSNGGVALYVTPTGGLGVEFNNVVDQAVGVGLAAGTPYHVVLGYNGATVTVWLSAVEHYLGFVGLPTATNGGGGSNVITGGPLTIQKVALYSALLPAARIAAHHAALSVANFSYPF